MSDKNKDKKINLTRRYTGALFILLIILVAIYQILIVSLDNQQSDARIINYAGRQLMLSQNIAKLALKLEIANTEELWQKSLAEMKQALTEWQVTDRGLQYGDKDLGLPSSNSSDLPTLFLSVDVYLQNISQSVEQLLQLADSPATLEDKKLSATRLVSIILAEEGPFLEGMDNIVFTLQKEAENKMAITKSRMLLSGLAIILVLFFISLFVLYPATKKTEELVEDLIKYKLGLDGASDHIIITDPNGTIIFASAGATRITGFKNSEMIGKKAGAKELWGGLMPKEFYQKMWQKIKIKKQVFIGEITNRRKNGEQYIASTTISPILDEHKQIGYYLGVERDITKEKEVDRAKTEFVSLASHQLRTPLSAVNWYTEMLMAGDVGKVNKAQKQYLDEIYKGNQRMVALVNALLNVSRIELGILAIDSQPTNLVDLFKSVINEMKPNVLEKKIKIEEKYDHQLPNINLDPKLARIVFQSFISNALKYSPPTSKIFVTVKNTGRDAEISVADFGMGIPLAQQDRVWQKLFRADNARLKETEGTGLGLYIVKAIIKQFGGKTWFVSKEDKGSTFYATIPLSGVKKIEGSRTLEYKA